MYTRKYNILCKILYHIVTTFLRNSCAHEVNCFDQIYSVKDQATAVHRALAYLDTNMSSTPASYIDTEIKRGIGEEIVLFLNGLPNIGGYIKVICGGILYMAVFQEGQTDLAIHEDLPQYSSRD